MATTAWTEDPASESQLSYLHDLAQKHEISDKQAAFIAKVDAGKRNLSKGEASRIIDVMRGLPKKSVSRDWPDIPAGRYAVVDPMDDVLKFYHVDKPTEGKWAGYTFLNVRASDEMYPIKNTEHKKSIMAEIAKDPKEASMCYGRELGHCGICGRTLTDEDSRERGIGPICAVKYGW
jgi:Family of unknown function (DUF6011)